MTYQKKEAGSGDLRKAFAERVGGPRQTSLETFRNGVIAGTAGGLAEVAWVLLYSAATGASPAMLARGVTTAAGVSALLPAAPAILGVIVHMILAAMLGIVLAFVWRALSSRHSNAVNPFGFVLAALVGVWAVNFLVVLPIVSPSFVEMVPYPVSLMSKMLFGLAAATALFLLDAPMLKARFAHIARNSS